MNSPIISLRPFRLTDTDDLMTWASDDQVTQFLRWKTLTSKEEALTFINNVCIPHPWCKSICIDDNSIGFISTFLESDDNRCRADVGYPIATEYWVQGITTRAVRMTIGQVFKDLQDIVRLQDYVDVENRASQRVLEKAGFMKEGLLRKYPYLKGDIKDLFVYSLLSTD